MLGMLAKAVALCAAAPALASMSSASEYSEGPLVDNGAYLGLDCRVHATLEQAKDDCSADELCSVLHDWSCDEENWRACSATIDALTASGVGDEKACTMVLAPSSPPPTVAPTSAPPTTSSSPTTPRPQATACDEALVEVSGQAPDGFSSALLPPGAPCHAPGAVCPDSCQQFFASVAQRCRESRHNFVFLGDDAEASDERFVGELGPFFFAITPDAASVDFGPSACGAAPSWAALDGPETQTCQGAVALLTYASTGLCGSRFAPGSGPAGWESFPCSDVCVAILDRVFEQCAEDQDAIISGSFVYIGGTRRSFALHSPGDAGVTAVPAGEHVQSLLSSMSPMCEAHAVSGTFANSTAGAARRLRGLLV